MYGECQPPPRGICSQPEDSQGRALKKLPASGAGQSASGVIQSSTDAGGKSSEVLTKSLIDCCVSGDDVQLGLLLAMNRCDVNWKDKSGRTPLSYAASSGHENVICLLQAINMVNPNLADNDGNTPLIYSVAMGHDAITSCLLKFPYVNVDQRNHSGFTALMKAAIQGHVTCVKQLLSAGASTSLRDSSRCLTATEWAKFCGSLDSYWLLEVAAAEAAAEAGDTAASALQPKRRSRGARPSSVRIRLPATTAAGTGGVEEPSASRKRGRLASLVRRIKAAMHFGPENPKDCLDSDVPCSSSVEVVRASGNSLVKRRQGKCGCTGDNAPCICNGAARTAKFVDVLLRTRGKMTLPKIKVTKAYDELQLSELDCCFDSDSIHARAVPQQRDAAVA